MLILLNKRWKSGSCLLLACQTMANKHSFPWLELFITVWILECNYALYLSCIIHTIIIPWLNYLFITRGYICSVSLEDFFFFQWCVSLSCPSSGWSIQEEPLVLSPWLVCWQFGQTSHLHIFMLLVKDAGLERFQSYKCLRMFALFSELSWEGLFIPAIIILWSLIWNHFRKWLSLGAACLPRSS